MDQNTKWDRRDKKRNTHRRMKVDGAGNRMLQGIILKKSEEAKNRAPSSK